jgi:hypothetical protein
MTVSWIASRELFLAETGRAVIVEIAAPEPDGENYKCHFRISGLGHDRMSYSMGVDSMQALHGAFELIGNRLYSSAEAKSGSLQWLASRDLGFPVAGSTHKP